jgi:predicted GNAT family acetyltransferase
MPWHLTEDLSEFLAAAGDFLRSRPVAHTVPLTVVESLRAGGRALGAGPPRYGWWHSADGEVIGAVVQTPPHPVLLTGMPEPAVAALPAALTSAGWLLPAITAGSAVAEGFAAAWRRHTGTAPRIHMRQRLYRLAALLPPQPSPPGLARVAAAADRDLLVKWYERFVAEAGAVGGVRPSVIDDRLSHGGLTLWEVDGTPVALGGQTRVIAGMARVAPIYTRPEQRRRGYGAAVTAAVSRLCQAAGARDVVLFTDLANPTSNSVYQRIGYRAVDDYLMLSLGSEAMLPRVDDKHPGRKDKQA